MVKLRGNRKHIFTSIFCAILAFLLMTPPPDANALTEQQRIIFKENHIMFWNPDEDGCDGSNVTIIGDSISEITSGGAGGHKHKENRNNTNDFAQYMPNAEIYAQWGKSFMEDSSSNTSGLTLIRQMKSSLRDVVVFALGTNDHGSLSENDFNTVIDELSGHTIVFMTFYTDDDLDWSHENSLVRQAASSHSNVKVADWASAVSSDPAKYVDPEDPWHPSIHDGTLLFAKTIYEAIDCQSNKECTSSNVEGNTAEQKIWNLLTQFLTDEQAAGVMGNIAAESGFSPVKHNRDAYNGKLSLWPYDIQSDTSYSYAIGLIQWTRDRRVGMLGTISSSYIDYFLHPEKYNHLDGNEFLAEVGDEVFDYLAEREVSFLQGELSGNASYQKFYSASSTPEEAADSFNKYVEVSGVSSSGRQSSARTYYNQYHGTSGSVTRCNNGGSNPGGGSGSGNCLDAPQSGGMTLAQAQTFMAAYRNFSPRKHGQGADAILDQYHIPKTKQCGDPKGSSDMENCSSFVYYFLSEYSDLNIRQGTVGDGGKAADNLHAAYGLETCPGVPETNAIFSTASGSTRDGNGNLYGHTGVVLGIDVERGKIIISEAGCSKGLSFTNAKEYELSKYASSSYNYAYTGSHVNTSTKRIGTI